MANLDDLNKTGVKFYASLTRQQAKDKALEYESDGTTVKTALEPGAICFVSDSEGNSIFLNGYLFGDGAKAGSGSGGGGLTVVDLKDIKVTVDKDGNTLKTLADYFLADGSVISDHFKVTTTKLNESGEDYEYEIVSITKEGISINGSSVATSNDVSTALAEAKTYADGLITGVYTVKGSVNYYSDLLLKENNKIGDVWNVINGLGNPGDENYIPSGTNYVYTENGWDALGGTTINLSAYVKTQYLTDNYKTATSTTTEINTAKDEAVAQAEVLDAVIDGKVTTLSNTVSGLSGTVSTNTNNIKTNSDNISTNTTNITNIATQLTWQ